MQEHDHPSEAVSPKEQDKTFTSEDLTTKTAELRTSIDKHYQEIFSDDEITEVSISRYSDNWDSFLPQTLNNFPAFRNKRNSRIILYKKTDDRKQRLLNLNFSSAGTSYSLNADYGQSGSEIRSALGDDKGIFIQRTDKSETPLRESLRLLVIAEIMSFAASQLRHTKKTIEREAV
ncbi:MAG TPA: hypothetical protein VLE91_02925 [Candidatus Saccharimonadales bacterium]|nr:hypothetical protein [Candidatus Saccharimonadales bacterium]